MSTSVLKLSARPPRCPLDCTLNLQPAYPQSPYYKCRRPPPTPPVKLYLRHTITFGESSLSTSKWSHSAIFVYARLQYPACPAAKLNSLGSRSSNVGGSVSLRASTRLRSLVTSSSRGATAFLYRDVCAQIVRPINSHGAVGLVTVEPKWCFAFCFGRKFAQYFHVEVFVYVSGPFCWLVLEWNAYVETASLGDNEVCDAGVAILGRSVDLLTVKVNIHEVR